MTTHPRAATRTGFAAVSALLFAASAALTAVWCTSMWAMSGMPMAGGWTMSMAWMRMPGQTWPGAAASFLAMWVAMMTAMMLPSLVPMLWRYRRALREATASATAVSRGEAPPTRSETDLGWLTVIVGAGYFAVWTAVGLVAFPLGAGLAALVMQQPTLARAVPMAIGVVVLMAGGLQRSAWKARRLACCTMPRWHDRPAQARAGAAWRDGLRLGLDCSYCCVSLMAVLLVVGVMDLRAMAAVTLAITAERLAPAGARVARVTGGLVIGLGLVLIARAAGVG